ncbi:hypothetical protein IQ247_22815 [Plectonema cf. radiosum LEGE 06105]|uniref:Uncharacterized protein n=1 Tax=Plectonema cf. radiosum LEGE 06105 TaxID=945769 RepID=A0A8J7K328_9CYAN|nr:hypothetical protein [Plectonema radiosum]MBE9215461.1 hypothetical protein [Plectonema cf. radiosum LEGE 06105]
MKLSSLTLSLISGTVALLGLGLSITKVNAQTTFPFQTIYKTQSTTREIAPNITEVTVLGESENAPYGLNNLESMSYVRLDPDTGVSTFVPDATEFGINDLPSLKDEIFGNSNDKLIGTSVGTAITDLENLTVSINGIINITDGAGRFQGATGILNLSENLQISPDPTVPLIGEALVTGSFTVPQRVPEAGNTATILSMGIIGTSLLLHKRQKPSVSNL